MPSYILVINSQVFSTLATSISIPHILHDQSPQAVAKAFPIPEPISANTYLLECYICNSYDI